MAPFDLDCPREQLEYTPIDSGTWGVTGCGKRTAEIDIKAAPHVFVVGVSEAWQVRRGAAIDRAALLDRVECRGVR